MYCVVRINMINVTLFSTVTWGKTAAPPSLWPPILRLENGWGLGKKSNHYNHWSLDDLWWVWSFHHIPFISRDKGTILYCDPSKSLKDPGFQAFQAFQAWAIAAALHGRPGFRMASRRRWRHTSWESTQLCPEPCGSHPWGPWGWPNSHGGTPKWMVYNGGSWLV